MNPDQFETITAREKYRSMVEYPLMVIMIPIAILFVKYSDFRNQPLKTSIVLAFILILYMMFKYLLKEKWLQYISDHAENDDQYRRIRNDERYKIISVNKLLGFNPPEPISDRRKSQVYKIVSFITKNKSTSEDNPEEIKLMPPHLKYEGLILVAIFFLVMSAFHFGYHWICNETFMPFTLVISLFSIGVIIVYLIKLQYKGIYLHITKEGINTKDHGFTSWEDIQDVHISQIHKRKQPNFVYLYYVTSGLEIKIDVTDYKNIDHVHIDMLIQKFKKS